MDELQALEALLSGVGEQSGSLEPLCSIDPKTRQITVPDNVFGVESDEQAKRVYFSVPTVVGDNFDLSKARIQINFRNANGDLGVYLVKDFSADAEGNATFSWSLRRIVTQYKGTVSFVVCATIAAEDNRIDREWNTTVAQGQVLEGIEVTQEMESLAHDIIGQILYAADGAMEPVEQATAAALAAAQAADEAREGIQGEISALKSDKYTYDTYKDINPSTVTATIISSKKATQNGDVDDTAYNIAEFDADSKTVYKIIAYSGSGYSNLRVVELIKSDEVVGYYDATENKKYTKYIKDFTGKVRVSYRNAYPVCIYSMSDNYSVVEKTFDIAYSNAYIGLDGLIHSTTYPYCVSNPIEMNKGDVLYASVYSAPTHMMLSETDVKGAKHVLLDSGINDTKPITYTADHNMYICVCGYDLNTVPYTIVKEKDVVVKPVIEWGMNILIGVYGCLMNTSSTSFKLSNPIKVYKGDKVSVKGYLSMFTSVGWSYQKEINSYQGVPTFIPLVTGGSASVERTVECMIEREGYIVVSANTDFDCDITITRSSDLAQKIENKDFVSESLYGVSKHNYVDDYDFVPNLEKKRINAICTYSGDTKKTSNHIANAVAYPNGEIIAARAGSGEVVRIANDGTETVLLTIPNAQDWRCVYMDSNLNVYVSPHSSTFWPAISNLDRGLYRMPYGGSKFTKVINLCNSTTAVTEWAPNKAYTVGQNVFLDNQSDVYICRIAHTSGSTFDNSDSKWILAPDWAANTGYEVGKIRKYNNCYFYCTVAHTSESRFDISKWQPANSMMDNDDTIWTMCEDEKGYLYAGVYSHSYRANPSIYRSSDGGITWFYQHNFITNGTLTEERYGFNQVRHVHCINFNEYDHCLYACVGETNTLVKSSNHGVTWEDMEIPMMYGQPTYVLGVKDGLLIGSDGHYSMGVSKLLTDGKTLKQCGRTAPGFIFNIRRSDVTGWIYAFSRIDNFVAEPARCPTVDCINDAEALENWKTNVADPYYLKLWTEYNQWASKYYPEDAIRPQNSVIMVSRDEGDTWEVFKTVKVSSNKASICGYITVGYFRDGECLVGLLKPIEGTESGKEFVEPLIISEGKKKRTSNGYDLDGEIFIKTNASTVIPIN